MEENNVKYVIVGISAEDNSVMYYDPTNEHSDFSWYGVPTYFYDNYTDALYDWHKVCKLNKKHRIFKRIFIPCA